MQVLAMHHRIHGEREIELARPFCHFELLPVRIPEPRDAIGDHGFVALEADLDMAKPGIGEIAEPLARQQHGRGDEVGVEPDAVGVLDQFDEVLACGRLAAGEMHLQHTDLGELGQHLLPFLGCELGRTAVELDRVGAIGALQRAAMRQLEQDGDRDAMGFRDGFLPLQHGEAVARPGRLMVRGLAHVVFSRASVRNPLSARSCSMASTSVAIASRGAAYLATSWSTMSLTRRTPSQSCSTSTAISSGARMRSGARITQTLRVSSNFSLACRGSTTRLSSLTVMWRAAAIYSTFRNKGARRNV